MKKDFGCIYQDVITNSYSFYCNGMHIQEEDVTARAGWTVFHVVREHMHLAEFFFFNNVIKW